MVESRCKGNYLNQNAHQNREKWSSHLKNTRIMIRSSLVCSSCCSSTTLSFSCAHHKCCIKARQCDRNVSIFMVCLPPYRYYALSVLHWVHCAAQRLHLSTELQFKLGTFVPQRRGSTSDVWDSQRFVRQPELWSISQVQLPNRQLLV